MLATKIVEKANALYKCVGSRDPYALAKYLDITIIETDFKTQKGAYKLLLKNAFIFIKSDLPDAMKRIVLHHEIAHHILHKNACKSGFQEFNLFDMQGNRMEYEANLFAAQIGLDDHEFLEYCKYGYDIEQIAKAMHSDINLVALKADTLIARGYRLRPQEYRNKFLK